MEGKKTVGRAVNMHSVALKVAKKGFTFGLECNDIEDSTKCIAKVAALNELINLVMSTWT